MKKAYIEPQCTVVALNVKESLLVPSNLTKGSGENGDNAEAREVLISEETTIIARSAWQSW